MSESRHLSLRRKGFDRQAAYRRPELIRGEAGRDYPFNRDNCSGCFGELSIAVKKYYPFFQKHRYQGCPREKRYKTFITRSMCRCIRLFVPGRYEQQQNLLP